MDFYKVLFSLMAGTVIAYCLGGCFLLSSINIKLGHIDEQLSKIEGVQCSSLGGS